MITYKLAPLYSKTDGSYSHDILRQDLVICDYCGRIIPLEHDEYGDDPGQEVSYTVNENGGAEPMFDQYYIRYKDIGIERDNYISSYDIFTGDHKEFFYCRNWDGLDNCEALMFQDFINEQTDNNWSMFDVMYQARINMLKKVIKKGTFTLKDFNL